MRTVLVIVLIVAAFGLGFVLRGSGDDGPAESPLATASEPSAWTCAMHPQFQLPEFGQCPICFMDLIPVEEGAGGDDGPRVLELSETAAALADIRTSPVVRRALEVDVPMVGAVAYDESRTRVITARVAGRIDTLFVDVTGDVVTAGAPLVSLYSPELYAAQAELLSVAALGSSGAATLDAARERLRLWGLTDGQIAGVEARGAAARHQRLTSPLAGVVVHKNALEGRYVAEGDPLYTVADLSRVWVELAAYETDLPWLREGQDVAFTVAALPGRSFAGSIVFVDPVLDPATRTVTVRLDADNADGALKPGMFVRATATGGPDDDRPRLTIPASAPLITGERAVVYVRLPGREAPTFEGRVVELGPRSGDRYVVASGLAEGEEVVTHGAFKLDSALQIMARPSMMGPGDEAPAPIVALDVPASFRRQVDGVLDAYLALQRTLAADDDSGSAAAAQAVIAAVGNVDADLAGDARASWWEDAARLRAAFGPMAAAETIDARRRPLQTATDALWSALRRYGTGRTETVRLFHCPMAYDDTGGDWIQLATTTANPYFGSMMLRCGGQADTLVVAGTR